MQTISFVLLWAGSRIKPYEKPSNKRRLLGPLARWQSHLAAFPAFPLSSLVSLGSLFSGQKSKPESVTLHAQSVQTPSTKPPTSLAPFRLLLPYPPISEWVGPCWSAKMQMQIVGPTNVSAFASLHLHLHQHLHLRLHLSLTLSLCRCLHLQLHVGQMIWLVVLDWLLHLLLWLCYVVLSEVSSGVV